MNIEQTNTNIFKQMKSVLSSIALSTLYLRDSIPIANELLECMKEQCSKYNIITDYLRKMILGLRNFFVFPKCVYISMCVSLSV